MVKEFKLEESTKEYDKYTITTNNGTFNVKFLFGEKSKTYFLKLLAKQELNN